MASRPNVFVTVGMGPWPFDRLLEGLRPVCADADVFAQTGTSTVTLPCPTAPFLTPDEVRRRLASADVVITHAGNTVRLAQRSGHVPIAVAREAARGEMGNDHQVAYLRREQERGRVVGVWNVDELPQVVARHPKTAARLVHDRPLPEPADSQAVADRLDDLVAELRAARATPSPGWAASAEHARWRNGNVQPFGRHPLQRYAFAWTHLAVLQGPHLEIGVGTGEFAGPLQAGTGREVFAVDVHPEYVEAVRRFYPEICVVKTGLRDRLPFGDAAFSSVALLDVLEHCADESALLAEAFRVLRPGGTLVVTVPRRHVFSWLDPDNAKYRWPRLHRAVYTRRFGDAAYTARFIDLTDGLRGDMAANRREHTNYTNADITALLEAAGFELLEVTGANLLWRWFQVLSLLLGGRARVVLGRLIALDGRVFRASRFTANLFVLARRSV
jgi:SAM-dependent methyltransferase